MGDGEASPYLEEALSILARAAVKGHEPPDKATLKADIEQACAFYGAEMEAGDLSSRSSRRDKLLSALLIVRNFLKDSLAEEGDVDLDDDPDREFDRDRFLVDVIRFMEIECGVPRTKDKPPPNPGGAPRAPLQDVEFVGRCAEIFQRAAGAPPTKSVGAPFHRFVLNCSAHATGEPPGEAAFVRAIQRFVEEGEVARGDEKSYRTPAIEGTIRQNLRSEALRLRRWHREQLLLLKKRDTDG